MKKTNANLTLNSFQPPDAFRTADADEGRTDSRAGDVYVFNDRIRLSVQVALATGRPLLVRGDSGWGKSSLAAASARFLGWDYREIVITSRTQARDMQWDVDLLLRLSDAQAGKLDPNWGKYVRPGALWWAFDAAGAAEQQRIYEETRGFRSETRPRRSTAKRMVVLLDEIDKADPDVPNNLLVTLGSLEFYVEETGQKVRAKNTELPLIFITTNEERELPAAFLRRCVEIKLPAIASEDHDGKLRKQLLIDIVLEHRLSSRFGGVSRKSLAKVAEILIPAPVAGEEPVIPSPAEFMDTILALVDLYGIEEATESDLRQIARMTLTKRQPSLR